MDNPLYSEITSVLRKVPFLKIRRFVSVQYMIKYIKTGGSSISNLIEAVAVLLMASVSKFTKGRGADVRTWLA